jgi:hypothetical protein
VMLEVWHRALMATLADPFSPPGAP